MVPAAAATALADGARRTLTEASACDTRRGQPARPSRRQPGGHSDRHHLPRRAPRVADRERQEAAADDATSSSTRTRRSASSTSCASPCPRRSGRQADQRRGRADHREGPGGGRADRRPGPGAGGVPHRRARPDPGGRGAEPPDHRRRRTATPTRSGAGADEYAVGVLVGLEGDVVKTLQSIKKGIALLDERRASLDGDGPTGRRRRRRRALRGRGGRARPRRAVTERRPLDAPLVWNVAGLLADDPGRRARATTSTTSRSTSATISGWPSRSTGDVRLPRTNRGHPGHAPTCATALALECSRCLREIELPGRRSAHEEALPSLDLATGRPLADRRRARRRCA